MSHAQNDKNISKLEKEIEELESQMRGDNPEEGREDEVEEVKQVQAEPTQEVTPDTTEEDETPEVENKQLNGEEKTFKKRYGDLRRHSQKREEELKKRIEALEQSKGPEGAPLDKKSVQNWMDKNRKSAELIKALILQELETQKPEFESRLEELEEMKFEIAQKKAEATILDRHPDYYEIRESDDFHNWVETQKKWVGKALYEDEPDGEIAADILDLYKMKTRPTDAPKRDNRKRDAARSVSTKSASDMPKDGKRVWKESEVSRLSNEQYEKMEEEILKAHKEGRFEYDLSKRG